MNTVQPIRNKQDIERMKAVLRRKSLRDYILFILGCNSALRVGDLLRLRVRDVRDARGNMLDHISLREEKTGKFKRFKLPASITKEIADYVVGMADDSPLFPSRRGGGAISSVQAWRILSGAAHVLNLRDIGTHSMRKTFGYHAYRKTKDVALLQTILNHTSQSDTLRYLGIDDDEVEKALEGFEL